MEELSKALEGVQTELETAPKKAFNWKLFFGAGSVCVAILGPAGTTLLNSQLRTQRNELRITALEERAKKQEAQSVEIESLGKQAARIEQALQDIKETLKEQRRQ